jgi:hypothetical protein
VHVTAPRRQRLRRHAAVAVTVADPTRSPPAATTPGPSRRRSRPTRSPVQRWNRACPWRAGLDAARAHQSESPGSEPCGNVCRPGPETLRLPVSLAVHTRPASIMMAFRVCTRRPGEPWAHLPGLVCQRHRKFLQRMRKSDVSCRCKERTQTSGRHAQPQCASIIVISPMMLADGVLGADADHAAVASVPTRPRPNLQLIGSIGRRAQSESTQCDLFGRDTRPALITFHRIG